MSIVVLRFGGIQGFRASGFYGSAEAIVRRGYTPGRAMGAWEESVKLRSNIPNKLASCCQTIASPVHGVQVAHDGGPVTVRLNAHPQFLATYEIAG